MKQIRQRLTYANVVSTLALFLVVGGATAIAAHKVAKHSVGPHQLKSNAVTTPKIKANAVTTRKIKKNAVTAIKIKDGAIKTEKLEDGAVTTSKIANGAVTGAKINPAGAPFGRIVSEARGETTKALPESSLTVYPLQGNAYTQSPGEDDTYIGALEVVIPESCAAPRHIITHLVVDPLDPAAPMESEFVDTRDFVDNGADPVTARISIGPAVSFQPLKPTTHTLYLAAETSCFGSGGGITAISGGIDVIGTK